MHSTWKQQSLGTGDWMISFW